MNRRDVMKGGVPVAAVVPALAVGSRAVRAQETVRTAGIGLLRQSWEQEHGPGEVGQNVVTYEGGAYSLQFAGDIVVYVELGWEDRGGIEASDATAAATRLIPSDAGLKEAYFAPPTAAGPAGLRVGRYQSPALADLMKQVAEDRTGGILVIYQETPSADHFEPNISRISIAVGMKARSVLDQPSGFTGSLA